MEYREFAFKTYVTDSLQMIPQNKYFVSKYSDIIKGDEIIDDRSADEIALDVILKAGLVVK